MADELPDDFPSKDALEAEGYKTISDVSEATDDELLAIDGIGPVTLDKIREAAPFQESPDESGTGETSGKPKKGVGPDTSLEPTAQSFQDQTSGKHKDQTDPTTGEKLPKGIIKNARGTMTASSTVEQDDMFSPERLAEERKNRLRVIGEAMTAAFRE